MALCLLSSRQSSQTGALCCVCVLKGQNGIDHTVWKTAVTQGPLSMSVLLLIVHVATYFNSVLKWLSSPLLSFLLFSQFAAHSVALPNVIVPPGS